MKRDEKAPEFLHIQVSDLNGNCWGKFIALSSEFSTGSVGFKANGKLINYENPDCKYQFSGNIVLIGSKG